MSLLDRVGGVRAVLSRVRPFARYLPHLAALALSARESQDFIRRSGFRVGGQQYYSLFDDGMISMRYAWHLAHGYGLVWNPGDRVEGFTNPLWTLVMAVAISLFSKPHAVLAMQIFGAVLVAIASVLYARMARRMISRQSSPLLAVFEGVIIYLLTGIFPVRFWSHMGMEVSAIVLLQAIAWFLVLERPIRAHRALVVGVVAAVAYAVRPDGMLAILPPLAVGVIATVTDRGTGQPVASLRGSRALRRWLSVMWARSGPLLRVSLRAAAPLVLTVVVVTLLRRWYYGDWLPNTYRLKMGSFPLGFRLQNGGSFLLPFGTQVWPLVVIGALACVVRRDLRVLALLSGPLLLSAYQVYVGGDPWPYWRQVTPGYPLLLMLCACLVGSVSVYLRKRARRKYMRTLAPIAATGLAVIALEPTRLAFADAGLLKYNVSWNETNVRRARVLNKVLRPEGRMAVFWAGTTPYYDTDHFAIDLMGKCDRHVADRPPDLAGPSWGGMKSVPGHNKTDLNYSVERLQADYTELLDWEHDRVTPTVMAEFDRVNVAGHGYAFRHGSSHIDWDALHALQAGLSFRVSSGDFGYATSGTVQSEMSGEIFFHTREEDHPWIEIDLGKLRDVDRVIVDNRRDCCAGRAVPLIVQLGDGRGAYRDVARRSGVFDRWEATFPMQKAKVVRLMVPRKTRFHLKNVEVP